MKRILTLRSFGFAQDGQAQGENSKKTILTEDRPIYDSFLDIAYRY